MQFLTPAQLDPVVRIANYHPALPGQSWANRRIPDLQVILAIEGEFEYREAESIWPIHPGEVLWIEPGVAHTFCCVETSATGTISGMHLELQTIGTWAAGDYRLVHMPERVTRIQESEYLQERFRRMASVFGSYVHDRELLVSTIAREILILLMAYWRQSTNSTISPRMLEMLRFIRNHLQQPLSRQELAAEFGLSPEHINLLFRQELGMTPSAVINRERVMLAHRLLHEQGQTVTEAAYAVGFSDPFYFSRVFKQILGVPPSQVQ